MGREFRAPDGGHPVGEAGRGRGRQQGPGRGAQGEVDCGVAQGQVPEDFHNLGLLRVFALEEFLPGRGIEEEFRHLHLGAAGRGPGRGLDDLAGPGHHPVARCGVRRATAEGEVAHRGDGGQGLAPKPQGIDAQQVGFRGELAGGVAL